MLWGKLSILFPHTLQWPWHFALPQVHWQSGREPRTEMLINKVQGNCGPRSLKPKAKASLSSLTRLSRVFAKVKKTWTKSKPTHHLTEKPNGISVLPTSSWPGPLPQHCPHLPLYLLLIIITQARGTLDFPTSGFWYLSFPPADMYSPSSLPHSPLFTQFVLYHSSFRSGGTAQQLRTHEVLPKDPGCSQHPHDIFQPSVIPCCRGSNIPLLTSVKTRHAQGTHHDLIIETSILRRKQPFHTNYWARQIALLPLALISI